MKKQPRNTQPSSLANSASGQGWAFVYEPDDPSCNPKAKWRVRFRRIEMSGQFDVEIRFRRRSGKWDTITISSRDRSEFDKIRRELCARDARLPEDRKTSLADYEATPRGVAEAAYARNDLVMTLDDTENGGPGIGNS